MTHVSAFLRFSRNVISWNIDKLTVLGLSKTYILIIVVLINLIENNFNSELVSEAV